MNTNQLLLRTLQEDDYHRGFLETLSNLSHVEMSETRFLEIMREMKGTLSMCVHVGEQNGQIIGAATSMVRRAFGHNGAYVMHLEDVATRKGHERKGVASTILRSTLEQGRSFGCYKAILNCSDKRVGFYEGLGFSKSTNGMRLDLA